MKILLEDLSLK